MNLDDAAHQAACSRDIVREDFQPLMLLLFHRDLAVLSPLYSITGAKSCRALIYCPPPHPCPCPRLRCMGSGGPGGPAHGGQPPDAVTPRQPHSHPGPLLAAVCSASRRKQRAGGGSGHVKGREEPSRLVPARWAGLACTWAQWLVHAPSDSDVEGVSIDERHAVLHWPRGRGALGRGVFGDAAATRRG